MTKGAPFRRISLIGVGLIGGSWGLALKRRGYEGHVTGCDRPPVLDRALALGAIDQAETDLAAAAHEADLVILAAPVGVILEQLPFVRAAASSSALVTDTGSTKRAILERARTIFRGGPLFLGGHPLAGKERSGIESAGPTLFEGTQYVLGAVEDQDFHDERVVAFRGLIEWVGARPLLCDAQTHDRALAFLSHLPQLLSTGLGSVVADEDRARPLQLGLAAAGFRDMTRLAESPYAVWGDVCLTNADNLGQALDALILKLERIKSQLGQAALELDFRQAAELRERWRRSQDTD
jgi:prephenate dehydrogenase